ncbi:hypothetical protein ACLOJK_018251, partial [Asimina triloba]
MGLDRKRPKRERGAVRSRTEGSTIRHVGPVKGTPSPAVIPRRELNDKSARAAHAASYSGTRDVVPHVGFIQPLRIDGPF